MTTTKELVDLLRERNTMGKYDTLIQKAHDGDYHDFQSEEPFPKMQLVEDLRQFPELEDIAKMAMSGDFDESLFDEGEA